MNDTPQIPPQMWNGIHGIATPLPHRVDPHVYRAMREMARLLDLQRAGEAGDPGAGVTVATLEHSARMILGNLVDDITHALTAESERLIHEAAAAPPTAPLLHGATRAQVMEQSLGFQRAAGMVASFLEFRRRLR